MDLLTFKIVFKFFQSQILHSNSLLNGCQFTFCRNLLHTLQSLTVVEISFNAVFWESLLTKLKTFYIKFVIPCLNAKVEKKPYNNIIFYSYLAVIDLLHCAV